MSAATSHDRSTKKPFFVLGIGAYVAVCAGILLFTFRVFGGNGTAGLSLILVFPFIVAVRMLLRWDRVRASELSLLCVLLLCVSAGSAFIIWRWYDSHEDRQHAEDLRFDDFASAARTDPAFRDVAFLVDNHNKCRYWIRGSVASQADCDRLQSLRDRNGFPGCMTEITVMNGSQSMNR